MSVKLADTIKPLGDFAVAEGVDIDVNINGSPKRLQEAIDNGEIGGGGDSSWKGTQAEFDALDKSTLKDGQEVIITDDYDSNGDIYSTEEIVVGKWIDGKPIYRKVLLCAIETKLDTAGTWTVVSGWSETPSDIKEFVRVDTSNVSLGNRIDYSIQANKTLKFYSLASYLFVKVGDKLILEYTKNAD